MFSRKTIACVLGCAAVIACADTPSDTVTVEIRIGSRGLNLSSVAFHGADGRLFDHLQADGDGVAEGPMEPGGMITWYDEEAVLGDGGSLLTVAGVDPGEIVKVGTIEPRATLEKTFVALPGTFPGAHAYSIENGCRKEGTANGSAQISLDTAAGCEDAAGTTILALAFGADVEPLAFAYDRPARTSPATIRSWRTDFVSHRVRIKNVPSDAKEARVRIGLVERGLIFAEREKSGLASSVFETTLLAPKDLGVRLRVSASIVFDDGALGFTTLTSTVPGTTELDANDALPRITALSTEPGERPKISWTTSAPPAAADLVQLTMFWANGFWLVEVPEGTSFTMPELPEEFRGSAPPAEEMLEANVLYSDFVVFDRWRSLKERATFPEQITSPNEAGVRTSSR